MMFSTLITFLIPREGAAMQSRKPPTCPCFSQTYYRPTFPSLIFIWTEIP